MTSSESLPFKPSKLGTKEHWDKVYKHELVNFDENGDEGEVWFGEESVEKMVDWALKYASSADEPSILEIGSGNGTLLVALAEAGFPAARLVGIDYSVDAVKLAQAVSTSHGFGGLLFAQCDFLSDDPPRLPHMSSEGSADVWDILMDKGTFDAIALGQPGDDGKPPTEGYPSRVERLLKPGGFFVVTSCNFTEEELKAHFIGRLTYHSSIKYPTFSFGGRSGSVCSGIAFQKVHA